MIKEIDKGETDMENVHKLEATVASWYEKAPHLPKEGSRWIAANAWWLALIGLVVGAFGVLGAISVTFFAGALLAGIGGVVGAAIGGLAFFAVFISLLFAIVILVIMATAIQPLKAMSKKGWNLLFIIMLLEVASLALTLLLTFDVFGTLWSLLWAAVGGYFLFEIRQYYTGAKKVEAKHETKPAQK